MEELQKVTSANRIQLRRDIPEDWVTANPVLAEAEIGIELGTNKFKIGNGIDAWNDLEYYTAPADLSGFIADLNSKMAKLIYDPTGISANVFDAGNLFGNLDGGTF